MNTPEAKSREQFLKDPVDGQVLERLVEAGLTWLRTNQQTVNALNVFPVPDGDTGTNMVLTMQAALDEVAGSSEHNIGKVAHAVAHGALMGARGNSGVILSQLWRGFARAMDQKPALDMPTLVEAFAVVQAELEHHPRYRDLRLLIIGDELGAHPDLRRSVIRS